MLLRLLETIPEELLPTNPDDLITMKEPKGVMEGALTSWSGAPHPGAAAQIGPLQIFNNQSPIVAVLLVLRKCNDEAASSDAPDLLFIADPDSRSSLRIDISTAYRAYGNGKYKAATVLAGAVVEVLLLWRIKAAPTDTLKTGITKHDAEVPSRKLDARDPEKWDLTDLIDVATRLKIIGDHVREACDLCREFRNLIHPGRVLRTGADASKGTALAALAAMQALLELP